MRTIVVLLIAALVLTPSLAHAISAPNCGGEGGLALLALPVLVILLVVKLAEKYPAATETPSSLPGPQSEPPSLAVPVPAVGSDR
jgi:hypothetical protein